jgi:membrane-associated protein
MDLLYRLFNFILHIDEHLLDIVNQYGMLTYAILFFIIFAETGFVVTPFLPGDSLLFAVGALAATGGLNVTMIIILLLIAAILGNTTNYWIGRYIGVKIFDWNIPFLKREYLSKTEAFYDKHGAKAVVIGRFLPFFRTFVPFVAGVGKMDFAKYSLYNIVGALLWVAPFTLAGYLFGNIPIVKENFSIVVLAIVGITALPTLIAVAKEVFAKKS